jgi:hypothetical protein
VEDAQGWLCAGLGRVAGSRGQAPGVECAQQTQGELAARRGRISLRGAGWWCAGCSARESDVAWVVSCQVGPISPIRFLARANSRVTSYHESRRLHCCSFYQDESPGRHSVTHSHLPREPIRLWRHTRSNSDHRGLLHHATTPSNFTNTTMFRRPGTGPSKASATTLCQKCLQRGHYSYECKARAQDRPYKSRPSRTQQLLNPRLAPALTTEVPSDLVRKKGVADDILAKKESERARGRGRKSSRGRGRSESTDSVSTISTDAGRSRSRSRSPPRKSISANKGKRRGRSSSASGSDRDVRRERTARRRLSSFSPEVRGRRRRDREGSAGSRGDGYGKKARRASVERSRETSRSAERMDTADGREKRARSRERSASPRPLSAARSPSTAGSRAYRSPSPRRARNGGRNRFDDVPPAAAKQAPPPPRAAPRERSLSPFSKRVALTRARNGGQ